MDSLIDALKGKPVEKEVEFASMKMKIRTLKRKEMDDVLRRSISDNPIVQMELMKKAILGYSLISLNGVDMEMYPDVREKMKDVNAKRNECVEDILSNVDVTTLNLIYDAYIELAEADRKNKESLKKASADQSVELSGTSSQN